MFKSRLCCFASVFGSWCDLHWSTQVWAHDIKHDILNLRNLFLNPEICCFVCLNLFKMDFLRSKCTKNVDTMVNLYEKYNFNSFKIRTLVFVKKIQASLFDVMNSLQDYERRGSLPELSRVQIHHFFKKSVFVSYWIWPWKIRRNFN